MLSLVAGVLVPAVVGASLGSFQSAEILAKDRNVLGLAGQLVAAEGSRNSLNFPAVEAWYRLGLGFGDFGVKLTPEALRGSLKLPIPINAESLRLAVEPAVGAGESLFHAGVSNFNTFTQTAEVTLLATFGDMTVAPRGAFSYARGEGATLFGGNTRFTSKEWLAGGTFTRLVKGEKVHWWGELGVYWAKDTSSSLEPAYRRPFLVFAPGIGASIEF
ncbi:MAG: hypothetical protein HYT87_17940 [Nitrospirae bacterium]|nr:hypothetical protein [Nitrospirota bacterium]